MVRSARVTRCCYFLPPRFSYWMDFTPPPPAFVKPQNQLSKNQNNQSRQRPLQRMHTKSIHGWGWPRVCLTKTGNQLLRWVAQASLPVSARGISMVHRQRRLCYPFSRHAVAVAWASGHRRRRTNASAPAMIVNRIPFLSIHCQCLPVVARLLPQPAHQGTFSWSSDMSHRRA